MPLCMQAQYWVTQLSQEMEQRLAEDAAENKRHASLLTLHFSFTGGHKSKAAHLARHDAATMAAIAMGHLQTWIDAAPRGWAITGLSLSASNFHGAAAGSGSIKQLFARKKQTAPHDWRAGDVLGDTAEGSHAAATAATDEQRAHLDAAPCDVPQPSTGVQDASHRSHMHHSLTRSGAQHAELSDLAPNAASSGAPPGRTGATGAASAADESADQHDRQQQQQPHSTAIAVQLDSVGATPASMQAQLAHELHSELGCSTERPAVANESDVHSARQHSACANAAVQVVAVPGGCATPCTQTQPHAGSKRDLGSIGAGASLDQGLHGQRVDALTLAQLPPELRAEVWASMGAGRSSAPQDARARKKQVAAQPGQRGLGAFVTRTHK